MELIINTKGTYLTKEDDCFLLRNAEKKQKLSPVGITSILLFKGVNITTDAIMLAVKKEIPVILLEDSGKTNSRIWSPKYGSISTIRKGQLAYCVSDEGVAWIKKHIIFKIESQIGLLLLLSNYDNKEKKLQTIKAVNRMQTYIEKIKELKGDEISEVASTIRAWEGATAKIYFSSMNMFLSADIQFDERTQHPAKDVFNAFLNFGYGVLYSKIEQALIKAGIDPYIGILHRDDYNKPAFVYDVIEPYRVWIDYVVVNLLNQIELSEEYFSVDADGCFWLENLGRRLLIQSINDYMEESTEIGGKNLSRMHQLNNFCSNMAKNFIYYYNNHVAKGK